MVFFKLTNPIDYIFFPNKKAITFQNVATATDILCNFLQDVELFEKIRHTAYAVPNYCNIRQLYQNSNSDRLIKSLLEHDGLIILIIE
jgi:hypothetical protein